MKRLFPLLITAACGVTSGDDIEVDTVAKYVDDCTLSDCGTNSTVIDGVYFSDLSLLHIPNDQGAVLFNYFSLPNGATKLDVENNVLVAKDALGFPKAFSIDLIGSQIRIVIGPRIYILRIADVHRTQQYWAAPGLLPVVETYTFEYLKIAPPEEVTTSLFKPVCDSDTTPDDNTLKLDAIVFEGDKYTAQSKAIDIAPPAGWFNIACLGGAPAKMHLMRHTGAASNPGAGITTTKNQRLALFNAWTANYCGDGHAFTFPGQPLRLRDEHGWLPVASGRSWSKSSDLDSYEAVWNETGAVCLDTPRLHDSDSTKTYDSILEYCKTVGHALPRCSDLSWFPTKWKDHGHIFSANPKGS